jgi:hypothetical protein
VTDSIGRGATAEFNVSGAPGGTPTMTVEPEAGPPGTTFTFTGSGFQVGVPVSFSLDGNAIGQVTPEGFGGFVVTLNTQADIPPATYTLVATQGNAQASAQFQIIGGGGDPSPGGLDITLVWTDPPAQANAASTLINNLDLRVDGPGGPYLGNGGTGPDTTNNVETVRLPNPQPGRYTIHVTATRVNPTFGSQPYALLATTARNAGAAPGDGELGGSKRLSVLYLPLVQSAPPPLCDQYEYNNNRYRDPAGPLASGQVYTAKICSNDQDANEPTKYRYEDNYYFNATAAGQARINLNLPPELVNHVAVLVYAQNNLGANLPDCYVDQVKTAQSIIPCALPGPGRYIVRLYAFETEISREHVYSLQVTFP